MVRARPFRFLQLADQALSHLLHQALDADVAGLGLEAEAAVVRILQLDADVDLGHDQAGTALWP